MAKVLTRPHSAEIVEQWGGAWRAYVVEAIGTFFLALTVVGAVLTGSTFTPLAAGIILMTMIYAGGHISGGHYNPAVTMAVLVRGRITVSRAVGYWIAQALAGVVAGVVGRAIVNPAAVHTLRPSGHGLTAAALAELLFTFALAYVVLNVATSKDHPNNGFYGLAIGLTVTAGAFALGGISGGSFNPAVSLGAAVGGVFAWSTLWIYLVVELAGGALAGVVFRVINLDDK